MSGWCVVRLTANPAHPHAECTPQPQSEGVDAEVPKGACRWVSMLPALSTEAGLKLALRSLDRVSFLPLG